MTRLTTLLTLFLLVSLYGFAQPPKAPVAHSQRPNILLVTIDTLRADHTGVYGSTSVETPTLNSIALESVVFELAISQVPLTLPSHASLLTGMYPFADGVQDFTSPPLSDRYRTVAQAFKAAGYSTGAVVSSFVLDRSWGLSRGFDSYDDAFDPHKFATQDLAQIERKAGESVDHALVWLRRLRNHPFFFWLHLYDPHSPYDPPEPYRTRYASHLYDGEIAYADHELGRFIRLLKRKGLYETTIIAVLADHGESLGEHGENEHGFFIYDSTVHVPLLIKPAAGLNLKSQRVSDPVEIMAVAPTLLALAGVKSRIQDQFQTTALITRSGIASAGQTVYSETFYPFSSFGWHPLRSLHAGNYQYIEAPQTELYDTSADPGETENLLKLKPAVAESLQANLEKNVIKNRTEVVASIASRDPAALEKLRQLGYMAYRAPVKIQELDRLPDPKQKIGELKAILEAQDAFHKGEISRGQDLLAEVREHDPKMYLVPFMLAEAEMRQQHWEEAATHFRESLQLNPAFDQSMTGIASALQRQGNLNEAKSWLAKALEKNPRSFRIHYQLGSLLDHSDPVAARIEFKRALELEPHFPFAHRDLGFLEAAQNNYVDAKHHLDEAIALGLADAHVYNQLGICESQLHELKSAIKSYKSALKLEPTLAEAHLNLALAYQRTADSRSAVEYKEACRLKPQFCRFGPQ